MDGYANLWTETTLFWEPRSTSAKLFLKTLRIRSQHFVNTWQKYLRMEIFLLSMCIIWTRPLFFLTLSRKMEKSINVCTTASEKNRCCTASGKMLSPFALSLDTFSGHLTNKVKDSFHKLGTTLLVIPDGFTSVLNPLMLALTSLSSRQKWCDRMVREAESGVSKITPASKGVEWSCWPCREKSHCN